MERKKGTYLHPYHLLRQVFKPVSLYFYLTYKSFKSTRSYLSNLNNFLTCTTNFSMDRQVKESPQIGNRCKGFPQPFHTDFVQKVLSRERLKVQNKGQGVFGKMEGVVELSTKKGNSINRGNTHVDFYCTTDTTDKV